LAWLLAHDHTTLAIPGTCDPRHLEENVAAAEVSLGAADLAVLDTLAREASE
jgi:aryl-alcohol dehydrogenase-like predicted oxidoreductase